jgi:hypothetical protein
MAAALTRTGFNDARAAQSSKSGQHGVGRCRRRGKTGRARGWLWLGHHRLGGRRGRLRLWLHPRRLLLLLLQLLLLQLLLLLLRHVMTHSTSRRSTQHSMMTGDVSCHPTDDRTLDAAFGSGKLPAGEEGDSNHGHRKRLHF